MPESADTPVFVVVGTLEDGTQRYWTGNMLGKFPEYLRSRTRAGQFCESDAKAAAMRLNQKLPGYAWTSEPL